MIKTLIVDDEKKSRETLATLLSGYCSDIALIATAESVRHAAAAINTEAPDLVFLDVSLPDGSGFDLLAALPSITFEIIIITAYNEYALPAIKANAIDYLLKPINIRELQTAVQKAGSRIAEKRLLLENQQVPAVDKKTAITDRIAIPVNDGLRFISIRQIIRMSAKGSYTEIYTETQQILSSRSLKDYEDILPAASFFRAHHSHIINLSYISRYHRGEGGYVTMNDGSTIDISKRKKKDFLDLFL